MGSFSWNKADELTAIENVAYGTSFKFLIPKEFGGGFIKDKYQDYGLLGTSKDGESKYDMYELLAFWNKAEGLKYDGEYPLMKEIDQYTDDNRCEGISIGCYDTEISKLKYPLKLVSPSFKGSYEDLADKLYGVTDKLVTCTKRLEILNREEDIVYPCIMLVDKIEDSSSPIKQVCIGKAGDKYLCAQSSADRVDWTLDYMKKNLDKSGMTCVLTAWPYAHKID